MDVMPELLSLRLKKRQGLSTKTERESETVTEEIMYTYVVGYYPTTDYVLSLIYVKKEGKMSRGKGYIY